MLKTGLSRNLVNAIGVVLGGRFPGLPIFRSLFFHSAPKEFPLANCYGVRVRGSNPTHQTFPYSVFPFQSLFQCVGEETVLVPTDHVTVVRGKGTWVHPSVFFGVLLFCD